MLGVTTINTHILTLMKNRKLFGKRILAKKSSWIDLLPWLVRVILSNTAIPSFHH